MLQKSPRLSTLARASSSAQGLMVPQHSSNSARVAAGGRVVPTRPAGQSPLKKFLSGTDSAGASCSVRADTLECFNLVSNL